MNNTEHFALRDGKIVYVENPPEEPVPYGIGDEQYYGSRMHKYKDDLQSAIANGKEVDDVDQLVMKKIYGQDGLVDGLPENFYAWKERAEGKLYPLQCRVELRTVQRHPNPDLWERIARVTFDEQEEKEIIFDDLREQDGIQKAKKFLESEGYIFDDPDFWMEDDITDHNWRAICELLNKYASEYRQPEAAGQKQENAAEQKTAEEFLKQMKPQVANFDKHDKVAKVFDYYDMTGFAVQYASQQSSADKTLIEELHQKVKEQNLFILKHVVDKGVLKNQIEQQKERIEKLEEAHERVKEICSEHLGNFIATKEVLKALNLQDNQKEK
jgi:hypothetical protein